MPASVPPSTPNPSRRLSSRGRRWRRPMVLTLAMAAIIGVAALLQEVAPPDPGSFYDPPPGTTAASPGQVLRSEPIDIHVDGAEGWRVLYRSSDRHGEANAVSGIVVSPEDPAPAEGRPVVAWAHPSTGVDRRCAPSLRSDTASTMHGVQEAIDAGWIWTATDYPGLGTPGPHPYLIGNTTAHATLDSVRAAQDLDIGAGNLVGLWGHSHAGHAVLWASSLASDYAPELDLAGVATAAPAIQLDELVEADGNSLRGNLLLSMAIASWADLYPEAEVDQIVAPSSRNIVDDAGSHCIEALAEVLTVGTEAAAELMVPSLSANPLTTEPWASLLEANTAPATVAVPLFIGQGRDDRIVRAETTEQVARDRCGAGETVELRSYGQMGHTDAGRRVAAEAMHWLADRFAGEPPPSSCPTLAR